MKATQCCPLLLICAFSLLAQAQAHEAAIPDALNQATLFPVSGASVRSAASSFSPSLQWSDARLMFRSSLGTRHANAPLRVTSVHEARDPRSVVLRVECRNLHDCAPFWVEMTFPQAVKSGVPPGAKTDMLLAGALQSGIAPPPLVRPGRPAALRFDENGLRISMPVVPLSRARLGETLKVLDPATRRVFLAQVTGVNLVRSDLREAK